MIVDLIKNADLYKSISERVEKGLEYLATTDLKAMEVGKYPLDGDNLFVVIQEYTPKKLEVAKMESHKAYIDIQYIIEGKEQMGYQPVEGSTTMIDYNPEKDVMFFENEGEFTTYTEGMFGIFFTQDGHMPGVEVEGCDKVKKAIVKIKK